MSELIHGNYVNFLMRKCRCTVCRDANRRESKRYRVQGPRNTMVDATRTHLHIQSLLAAGMSFNALAKTAGYSSRNALVSILESKRVRATTQARILAVTIESDTRPEAYVSALGSRRRLQALAAIGYSHRDLAAHLGVDRGDIQHVQSGSQKTVRRFRAEAIAAMFDTLSMTLGGNTRAAAYAARQRWAAPLAWDEGAIDNPKARPHGHEHRVIHARPSRRRAAA